MDPFVVLGLVALAFMGAPLFAIFGAASMVLFSSQPDGTITSVAVDVFSERFADSPTLVTLPLFVFAGYILAEAGTPRRLVRVSRALFGWMPGGIAVVCLIASAFFTTFTGGSGITIVAIGGLLYPALVEDKYDEKYSLGLVTTAGSLGLLFPPSLPIVLYAVVAGILIDKLFLAGMVPGVITVLLLVAHAAVVGWKHRPPADVARAGFIQFLRFLGGALGGSILWGLAAFGIWSAMGWGSAPIGALVPGFLFGFFVGTFATSAETRAALLEASWELVLPIVLVGGLFTGILRIHEAAAFTALYCLIVEVFVYKDISIRKDLPRVIRESMTMLGAILAILATALGFTAFMIQARVPELLLGFLQQYITSDVMFLLVLNGFLIVVGMLMDIFSAIVVVVPLIVPIAAAFGIDPYHLGIVFLLNLEIGYLTPPVGLNLFISSFRFGKPVTLLYGAVLPFIGILIVALAITTYIPSLSTSLASIVQTEEIGRAVSGGGDALGDDGGDGATLDDLDDGATLDDLDEGGTLDDLDALDDLTLDDLDEGSDPLLDDPGEAGEGTDEPLDDIETGLDDL